MVFFCARVSFMATKFSSIPFATDFFADVKAHAPSLTSPKVFLKLPQLVFGH